MTQFPSYLHARFNDHETTAALRSLQGSCRKKRTPLTPPAILPILLGLVDVCQSSELQEQSETALRTAALARKENPVRL